MNLDKRFILAVVLPLILLALPAAAFAKGLGILTITGPGIRGELTLSGPEEWGDLEDTGFFWQEVYIEQAPENLGQGYAMTASIYADGKIIPFAEMVYYPAEQGQPGYFHYTGRLDGMTLQRVDLWGVSSRQGDRAFRALMSANNVTVQSAISPASTPLSSAAPIWAVYTAPAVLGAIAALLILKRRTNK